MFQLAFGAILLAAALVFYWVLGRWLALYGLPVKSRSMRLLRAGVSLGVLLVWGLWSPAGLIALHLAAFFALAELLAALLRRLAKGREGPPWYRLLRKIYRTGLVPALLTALLLGWGSYNMGRIVGTEYTIASDKLAEDRDILLITDLHYDTVQNPEVLSRKLEEINALKPDLVVLGGDIVDEGTSRQAMEQAFRQLGGIESRYGVYYVYGNHDRQLYADLSGERTYTEEQLAQAIESAGITILRDRAVPLGPDLLLAGREDLSYPGGRASAAQLLAGQDLGRFAIVADHQPVEAAENAALGVDLQLSGHTHAGQIWPAGRITQWVYGFSYGQYWQDNCCLIVSSGAAGWGFAFRTEQRCEYVTIHLKKA